ncbi:MAG: hypothetical protein JNK45_16150 [Myxococcales bacterium]|nr:hypothetical protein [Myxococcales bacterium]
MDRDDQEIDAVLAAARRAAAPSPLTQARVRRRVVAGLAGAAATAAVGSVAKSSSWLGLVKFVALPVALAGFATAVALERRAPEAPAIPSRGAVFADASPEPPMVRRVVGAPAGVAVLPSEPSASVPVSSQASVPVSHARTDPRPRPPNVAKTAALARPDATLAAELAALAEVNHARAEGRLDDARASLSRYRVRFPGGQMATEARVLELVITAAAGGPVADACAEFVGTPSTLHDRRVATICGEPPPTR